MIAIWNKLHLKTNCSEIKLLNWMNEMWWKLNN